MQDLEKTKELYESGEYVALCKQIIGQNYMIIKDCKFTLFSITDYKLIHKKHKAVLDAWLLDNDVEIEVYSYCSKENKTLFSKEESFIESYNERFDYRLKEKQIDLNNTWCEATPETRKALDWQGVISGKYFIVNEYGLKSLEDYFPKSIHCKQIQLNKNNEFEYVEPTLQVIRLKATDVVAGMEKEKQMTQIEHFRRYGFELPEFECQLKFEENKIIFGIVNIGHAMWDEKGNAWRVDCLDVVHGTLERVYKYDLTPIKKPWFEDESNFPALVYDIDQSKLLLAYDKESIKNKQAWHSGRYRLATNEEIENLKVKE